MKNNTIIQPSFQIIDSPTTSLSREGYLALLRTSLELKRPRFAKDVALSWLAHYPGDLQISYLYAKALTDNNNPELAKPIIESICLADPEFYEAVQTMLVINHLHNTSFKSSASDFKFPFSQSVKDAFPSDLIPSWFYALRGPRILNENFSQGIAYDDISPWGQPLWQARRAIKNGDMGQAEKMLILVLGVDPPIPLVQATHLKFFDAMQDVPLPAKLSIAEHYHRKWPDCLPITLMLAHWLMDSNDISRAVTLLHKVAANDIGGQVINRLWGRNHPYKDIWASALSLPLEIQIPAEIATRMGWNQIPRRVASQEADSSVSSSITKLPDFLQDEVLLTHFELSKNYTYGKYNERDHNPNQQFLRSTRNALERIAKKVNLAGITNIDGRFPVYVIFSSREGLIKKFGEKAANQIIGEMNNLVGVFQENIDKENQSIWGSCLFLPDDPSSTKVFDFKAITQNDPWKLKLALRDLDLALSKKGEMIGALLIVGGPDVIPFHNLPNPVDDPDKFIASDNPYGTCDENYFLPDWPVGRILGGKGSSPDLLIETLRNIQKHHSKDHSTQSWYKKLLEKIKLRILPNRIITNKSFGYTAAVWQQASLSVFKPIGDSNHLYTSPPHGINGKTIDDANIPSIFEYKLGYFNLHGLSDAAEWYGQSDPYNSLDGPEYPIAIRPQDVVQITQNHDQRGDKYNKGLSPHVPQIIFSEACYGANVINKTKDEALSLIFLSAGTLAVIGSTCMSYGAIGQPLIAADLLGHSFWQHLRSGVVAGEALRLAKIDLASEMHNRQGYLDGEDQKTLISFILYGDPMAQFMPAQTVQKSVSRLLVENDTINTVCDRTNDKSDPENISSKEKKLIKQVVAQYLPGMENAELNFAYERAFCEANDHVCPTSQLSNKNSQSTKPKRKVFTLRKKFYKKNHLHQEIARLTLDENGKLVKLAISR